jgi:nitroimidazol reductase NimA-like FMN-containing flavoprotein (pyridoxamine 5'-phosphate oxidase superfamily)
MSRAALRRKDKEMTPEEIDALLERVALGHFATVGPDGEPYVIPNLFVYAERMIYLHTTRAAGHFRYNVERNPKICFEAAEMGQVFPYGRFECDTSTGYASVIGFGGIQILGDTSEKARFFDRFLAKYADPAWTQRPKSFYPRLDEVVVYAIVLERITGKKSATPPVGEQWPVLDRTKSPGAVPPPRT